MWIYEKTITFSSYATVILVGAQTRSLVTSFTRISRPKTISQLIGLLQMPIHVVRRRIYRWDLFSGCRWRYRFGKVSIRKKQCSRWLSDDSWTRHTKNRNSLSLSITVRLPPEIKKVWKFFMVNQRFLYHESTDNSNRCQHQWMEVSINDFNVEEAGDYYFSFHVISEKNRAGFLAWQYYRRRRIPRNSDITLENLVLPASDCNLGTAPIGVTVKTSVPVLSMALVSTTK